MKSDFEGLLAQFRDQESRAHHALMNCPVVIHRLRPAGFEGLLRLIVEQQLSVSAAASIKQKLWDFLGDIDPNVLLRSDDQALRNCGLSRPKITYAKVLALSIISGEFSPDDIRSLPDDLAILSLTKLKGIGLWSAEVYLMFCEGRLDLFPAGDIALREAVAWLDEIPERPSEASVRERAMVWNGYRSVAAHALWALYGGLKSGLIAPR